MLSSLYLWHIRYSCGVFPKHYRPVVICFQVYIFDILDTAPFAALAIDFSCNLLSSLYLWHIRYSRYLHWGFERVVVICFQVYIFDILDTALLTEKSSLDGCNLLSSLYLWHIRYSLCQWVPREPWVVICFQVYIFDILDTASACTRSDLRSCNLLSSLYLWHIRYSWTMRHTLKREL